MGIYKFKNTRVLIRGAGDIGSGIAHRLFNAGFSVFMAETAKPSAIRRKVSFSEAVYEGRQEVEGVTAVFSKTPREAISATSQGYISVFVDPELTYLKAIDPLVVVDAILAKKNLGTNKKMAEIVIGVGPGFEAGVDCHAVIETQRGHNLGKVIIKGKSQEDTGIPGEISGFTAERVIYAPTSGKIKLLKDIGDKVEKGEVIAVIGDFEARTRIDGIIRGMIRDGYDVSKGMKIGDVDPRGVVEYCYTISDKARAVGGGVLEAILFFMKQLTKKSLNIL